MELKKNPHVSLKKKTFLFFLIGLLFAQLFVFVGFTYRTSEKKLEASAKKIFDEDLAIIENTEQVFTPPPPPPPQTIEIVEDDSEADDNVEIADTEINQETEIKMPVITAPPIEEKKEAEIFEVVEQMPEYPGGEEAMMKFITKNFNYPPDAKRFEIEGRVLVTFVVNEDGTISNVKPLLPEARRLGYGLEEEAIRVVKMMPNWKPGKQRNKAVKVQYILPIVCQLSR
jgi:periplasmic protein TonB